MLGGTVRHKMWSNIAGLCRVAALRDALVLALPCVSGSGHMAV